MQYCEQQLAHAAFEPWNALSNLAFVAAAFMAWREAHTRQWPLDAGVLALLWLALAIGVGSFAWHATHAAWAELADVIPILLFVLWFLFLATRRFHAVPVAGAVALCGAMLGAIVVLTAALPRALNGSISYVPVWLGLGVLAGTVPTPATRRMLGIATAVFTVALTARTVDLAVCATLRHGSHWLWHLGNGGVIYLALRVSLQAPRADAVR